MLPTFARDPRGRAGRGGRSAARGASALRRGIRRPRLRAVEALCADPAVEVVYVATPHQFHADARRSPRRGGKHVLVEKPMAITLDECRAMIDAARTRRRPTDRRPQPQLRRADPAHARDHRERRARRRAHDHRAVLHRLPVPPAPAGGARYRRRAAARSSTRPRIRSTSCGCSAADACAACAPQTGAWDAARPTEGAYAALLDVRRRRFASLAYSGYAHFDGDELCGGVGEWGGARPIAIMAPRAGTCAAPPIATRKLASKNARNYGGADYVRSRASPTGAGLAPAFRPGPRLAASAATCGRCRTA